MTRPTRKPAASAWNAEHGKRKPSRDVDKDHSGPPMSATLRKMDPARLTDLIARREEEYLIALDARRTATGKARTLATMDAAAHAAFLGIAKRI
jgi:hypothetical protein